MDKLHKEHPKKNGKMRNLLVLALATITFISTGCQSPESRESEISRIDLATDDCLGTCQKKAVSIDSSLFYGYYGGEHGSFSFPEDDTSKKKLDGYYSGRVDKLLWDSLLKKLEQIHYRDLDTSYIYSFDGQGIEVVICYGNKIKHIDAQATDLPDSVRDVFYWIANSYRRVKLRARHDSLQFKTHIQKPGGKPVRVDRVKFPPPVQ